MMLMRTLAKVLLAIVVIGLAVRSIVAMRGNSAPWSNYYGAPVTPLFALLLAAALLAYLLFAPNRSAQRPTKPKRALFRTFRNRPKIQ
jgi:hypothetical protein